jgi:tetratricopeptide (TPR) repeat protein
MRAEEGLRLARWIAERVAEGQLSREQAERELAEQLREDCPACRERYDETLAALYAPPPAGIVNRRHFAEWLSARLAHSKKNSAVDENGAGAKKKRSRALSPEVLVERGLVAFATLQKHQWPRRRERVRLEWQRFRGVEVARLMLAEALAALPGKPDDSREWAELVLMVLGGDRYRAPASGEALLLRLRARLLLANAERCRGELDTAAEEMAFTLRTASEFDVRDLAFWAEAKSLLSTLRRNQRDFPAAAQAARETAALARAAGLPKDQVRASLQLAALRELQGDFAAALSTVRPAVPLARELADPVIELGVRHGEASLLARARSFEEAARAYRALVPLYDQLPEQENRRSWLFALISAGLERPEEAENSFRAAREGFLTEKNPYDAALVTLDWALFLLDQNRVEEVLPLAVSMGQAFEALGVARETMASWAIFQAAAERRELDRAVAAEVVEHLGSGRAVVRK